MPKSIIAAIVAVCVDALFSKIITIHPKVENEFNNALISLDKEKIKEAK